MKRTKRKTLLRTIVAKERLSDFQSSFSKALLDASNDYGVIDSISNKTIPSRRLDVYRNNVVFSLIEALQDLCPVTLGLIGEQAFGFLTKHYVLKKLPKRATLIGYGASFADCIDESINRQEVLS